MPAGYGAEFRPELEDTGRLTTDFLGGFFSLDGIHPTYTGHALLANEFIHVLNAQLMTLAE